MDNSGVVLYAGHLNAAKEISPLSVDKLGCKVNYVQPPDNVGRDDHHRAPGKGNRDGNRFFASSGSSSSAGTSRWTWMKGMYRISAPKSRGERLFAEITYVLYFAWS